MRIYVDHLGTLEVSRVIVEWFWPLSVFGLRCRGSRTKWSQQQPSQWWTSKYFANGLHPQWLWLLLTASSGPGMYISDRLPGIFCWPNFCILQVSHLFVLFRVDRMKPTLLLFFTLRRRSMLLWSMRALLKYNHFTASLPQMEWRPQS